MEFAGYFRSVWFVLNDVQTFFNIACESAIRSLYIYIAVCTSAVQIKKKFKWHLLGIK